MFTVSSRLRREFMAEERSYLETWEPECDPPDGSSPLPEDWTETTLRRLEEWVAERERLIAEIERRIEKDEPGLSLVGPGSATLRHPGESAANGAARA